MILAICIVCLIEGALTLNGGVRKGRCAIVNCIGVVFVSTKTRAITSETITSNLEWCNFRCLAAHESHINSNESVKWPVENAGSEFSIADISQLDNEVFLM